MTAKSDTQRAQNVNARGPELLALASRRLGALFITISTDYVFDGEKEGFLHAGRSNLIRKASMGFFKTGGETESSKGLGRTIVVRSGYNLRSRRHKLSYT